MTRTVFSVVPLLLAVPFWTVGCIDMMGFPPAEFYEDPLEAEGSFFEDSGEPDECEIPETEPNGLDDSYEFDTIGALLEGQSATVCGRISSTGVDGEGYFDGDYDYYLFELLHQERVTVELRWEGSTGFEMILLSWSGSYSEQTWGDEPLRISDTVPAGYYAVLVVAGSGSATDYQLLLEVD